MTKPRLSGRIRLRGDKSLSHRLLMFASLEKGTSEIRNLSAGADVNSTLAILRQLGVSAERDGDIVRIIGCGLDGLRCSNSDLYCGNSGTTLRLSLGILAGSRLSCRLSGDKSLNRRPVTRVITPLRQMGADLRTLDGSDHPPVSVNGKRLHGTTYDSPVASAQVKSAVLLAALHAEGDTIYTEPQLSRDHTERFLEHQGVNIEVTHYGIRVSPPAVLTPFSYDVPGDISTAMFFIVAATLLPGSELVIENVLLNPTRTGALDILREMGASVEVANQKLYCNEPVGDVVVRSSDLRGVDASAHNPVRFIDEVPILAVAAALAQGNTSFAGLGELRLKESNRLQGITDILQCYGCEAESEGDRIMIRGGLGTRQRLPEHLHDHRLAMAIEVMELVTTDAVYGDMQECIAISAPEFYHTLRAITK